MDGPIDVLHVDDDEALLDIVATFLERSNDRLRVATESDPDAALRRVETESFDCVLSDYEMPGMNGIELLERIRQTRPDLPVVLFTGVDDASVAIEAIECGAVDCYRKRTGTDHYRVLAARLVRTVDSRRERPVQRVSED
ncbi:response regulator [Salinirubellus salinus]|jgi:DNA-binding NtrC family response regulator|uniref:Response regulator n=1 Tax=Salinirubellus salinus TaxID=1364945 RepID=A0A9E7U856_9EURY|nr:response regulator [Salinirubellus salinus]UWM54346.1 response regulator [Salinirubellus salinus]